MGNRPGQILLFNPPAPQPQTREGRCTQSSQFWQTTWPPLTLATLAAVVREDGFEVTLVDCARTLRAERDFIEFVSQRHFDALVWPVGNLTPAADLGWAATLRAQCPKARTAVFGTFPTALAGECLARFPEVDAIVLGEPEAPSRDLMAAWFRGEAAHEVPGVAFQGKPLPESGCAGQFVDPNDLPYPAWDLLAVRDYPLPLSGRPFLLAAPSRGCPHRCSFCTTQSYYGRKVRRRDPGAFVDELERDARDFGVRDFLFWSDTFTLQEEHVLQICAEIGRRNLKVRWACNSRVDSMSEPMAREMRKAGCWIVSFGIESSSQEILDRCGKHLDVSCVRDCLAMVRKTGLLSSGHFVLGLPGETRETARATVDFAASLPIHWAQFYAAAPWPGSELYAYGIREGRMKSEDAWEGISQDHARVSLCDVSPDAIDAFVREGNRRFHRRPATWWASARQVRPRGLRAFLGGS